MGNLNIRLLVNTRQGYPETQLLINPTPHNAKDNIPLDLCVCKHAKSFILIASGQQFKSTVFYTMTVVGSLRIAVKFDEIKILNVMKT